MNESTQIRGFHKDLVQASRLFEEKIQELSVVRRVWDSLKYTRDVRKVFEAVIDTILDETNAENCSLMLLNRETGELTLKAARGQTDDAVSYYQTARGSRRSFRVGEGIAGWVAQHGKPISIPDVSTDSRFVTASRSAGPIGSLLCLPLTIDHEVVGVVNLSHPRPNVFIAEDERLMTTLANQVAVALNSVQMFDEMQQMNALLKEQIAERKRAEEALRESNRRLEEALAELRRTQQQIVQQERLRALGQMASGIAHDFNNALSPIVGFSELLLMNPKTLDDKEKATRFRQTIHTAARDAASMVGRLREFYRHRDEREIFLPVDLNQVVEQAISLTQPRWKDQALANGVTVGIETDLRSVLTIAGNEVELREVLTNLIFNAVDAMPEDGMITLRTRRDGDYVTLEVRDTGTGMTEEVRQRCLDPFFSTKGERGTGLGLAMAFGIIQRHKGTLDVQSEPGKGTTFTVRLPIQIGQKAEEKGPAAEALPRSFHVLVVDDDLLGRNVITEYLTGNGHTVETAANGREGLEKFQAGRFDLVVTDRAMPEMSGDQMAAVIKRIAPAKPVIMLTGFGDVMQAADEQIAGVDFILGKPVTLAKLREATAKVMAGGTTG